jgi:hypothetical protein
VVLTLTLVYLSGVVLTIAATYLASRRLADHDMTPLRSLGFSLLAGLVWPLMIVGAVELSSMAMYATATSNRHDSDLRDSWLGGDAPTGVVLHLR